MSGGCSGRSNSVCMTASNLCALFKHPLSTFRLLTSLATKKFPSITDGPRILLPGPKHSIYWAASVQTRPTLCRNCIPQRVLTT